MNNKSDKKLEVMNDYYNEGLAIQKICDKYQLSRDEVKKMIAESLKS